MIIISLKLALLMIGLGVVGLVALVIFLQNRALKKRQSDLVSRTAVQDIFSNAPLGLIILRDESGYICSANDQARQLLSLNQSTGEPPDLSWRQPLLADVAAVHAQTRPRFRKIALSDHKTIGWWVQGLSGSYWVLLTDLNRQDQIDAATQAFIHSLSHELRTPLTAILAHVEVLRRPDLATLSPTTSLDIIHQETLRLSHLVNELLMLNRLETLSEMPRHPLNIVLLVESCISEIFPLAESQNIAILLEADSPSQTVRANQDYLKQVFLNLLDNAIKYCRPGDEINVSLKNTTTGVACQVADNGPGIAREHLPHLTQKFYRARTDKPGSGLGLTLVAEILRLHNTRLEIQSQAEGATTGTAISFLLPNKN